MNTAEHPVFDRQQLLDRMGGDEELLVEILGIFRDESARMLDEVRDAVSSADAHKVERSAHSLKGALLNIAAESAAACALELEDLGREGHLTSSADVLSRLESEIASLNEAIA